MLPIVHGANAILRGCEAGRIVPFLRQTVHHPALAVDVAHAGALAAVLEALLPPADHVDRQASPVPVGDHQRPVAGRSPYPPADAR